MSHSIEIIRHSLSHILADAVLQIFPDAKLGIGPAIDDGFYYDFDLPKTLTTEDLIVIENKMREIIKTELAFNKIPFSKKDAIELVEKLNQPYKKELILELNDELTFFQHGNFIDLCKGPHVNKTSDLTPFKLLKVSGAYWRGSEKNKMLQRIYGTAWLTEQELTAYLQQQEEALTRDHRHLGVELDLFSTSDAIGSGLILWHPKGARIRHIIEDYWKKEHFKSGYELLYSPHIGLKQLWETSGHLDFYHENMYSPINIDEQEYFLKPMNCPFHIMMYKNKLRSYRDLPLRWAELGTVYRYERSGVLHGLLRVRGFTQDDAHLFCTHEQMPSEIKRVIEFSLKILNKFGFTEYEIFLSTKPKDKYVGELKNWEDAENALKQALTDLNIEYKVDEGGGAFYGPKIDIKIKDALNREWQCSTIQFDFNLPERFDMTYINNEGKKTRPFMIHRALLGSLERFFGILIEHYKGKFPLWLSPEQVRILTLNQEVVDYAEQLASALEDQNFRVSIDSNHEKIGQKIRLSIQEKIPYALVIGKKEKEQATVSVRSLTEGDLGILSLPDFMKKLQVTA
ncbi:MAG: threonine--tRNA ligase [Candidatus Margulisiibacteriota bacterium]|jgi:threonyl-tRNA synthetase